MRGKHKETNKSRQFSVVAPDQLFSCATNRCQFKLRSRRAETAAGCIFGSLMLHPQMCENDP